MFESTSDRIEARSRGAGFREPANPIEPGVRSLDLFPGIIVLVAAIDAIDWRAAAIDLGPVQRAVSGRRAEYAAGRVLALAALARLGIEAQDIGVAPNRAPAWPPGSVGSISHSMTQVAVAVSRSSDHIGIGIDLEAAGSLGNAPLECLFTAAELGRFASLDLTLIFSAKEALYKLLNPILGRYVDHLEVEIQIEPRSREFRALTNSSAGLAGLLRRVRGRYLDCGGYWVTCAVLAAG